jgi:hypothetical protein
MPARRSTTESRSTKSSASISSREARGSSRSPTAAHGTTNESSIAPRRSFRGDPLGVEVRRLRSLLLRARAEGAQPVSVTDSRRRDPGQHRRAEAWAWPRCIAQTRAGAGRPILPGDLGEHQARCDALPNSYVCCACRSLRLRWLSSPSPGWICRSRVDAVTRVRVDADKKLDESVSLDEDLGVFIVERRSRLMAFSDGGPHHDEPIFYCPSSRLFETTRSDRSSTSTAVSSTVPPRVT